MSDKYILRSGAIDAVKRNSGSLYTREAEFLLRKVVLLLKHAPKADVEQVVYCKDCCYCRDGQCVSDEISRRFVPEPYDYCSCGKLKVNGGRDG
nr:MAG TPA: hypothetical protein [Caudoviricetes sp.]